jgi:hypothetical protein
VVVGDGAVVVAVPLVVMEDLTKVKIRSDSDISGRNKFCMIVMMDEMD